MTVRGELRTMSAEDLLEWVDRRKISATLTVEWAQFIRTFAFDSGVLVGSSCNEPNEHVGQLALAERIIDRATLKNALQRHAASGPVDRAAWGRGGVARVLADMNAVAPATLRRLLEEQAREAVCDVLAWTEGEFVVERSDRATADVAIPVAVPLGPCIEEARRRAVRWKRIHQIMPPEETVLRIADRDHITVAGDDPAARRDLTDIAAAIHRGSSIGEIVLERQHRRFEVLDRLVLLIERGAVVVPGQAGVPVASPAASLSSPTAAPEPVTPDGSAPAAMVAAPEVHSAEVEALIQEARELATSDPQAALDHADRARAHSPGSLEISDLHSRIERALFARLCREFLATYRVPTLAVARDELEGLDMTESERYLAGRVDGRWDLLSLMRASSLRDVDALITFKRLADRGIISL